MPNRWGKQIFSLGRFPEVGQKQKTEKREREKERPKVCNNNGQLRIAMPPIEFKTYVHCNCEEIDKS